ncbi:hypothetical protein OTSGILL_2672 [Orientia tsutsugamushi str. Gilliam]|uniref:Uncharacterized protein n=1 Tax=Orientia tsutsugamushi str. Gilliam TaxID=1359184 RepID=A0A0F3M570_ORITS|nr:hypothetical protein [Orientia tsutsugamushi]KJV50888.1 hypothetical protein OTSGILL_2672 [Orientia tsutsugamushi str. Gilliam]
MVIIKKIKNFDEISDSVKNKAVKKKICNSTFDLAIITANQKFKGNFYKSYEKYMTVLLIQLHLLHQNNQLI